MGVRQNIAPLCVYHFVVLDCSVAIDSNVGKNQQFLFKM